ncbi:cytochrome P450 [Exidia glandulosa HHB12029]|uniref:Cytochrome P450 n=1 Tax=Exidia glandulosa HHB12029 TaxID=1314781 RepID=A0A165KRZ8_EXIGL|nr:cytochrome P450 [Exidia glandulosa HHB12029]
MRPCLSTTNTRKSSRLDAVSCPEAAAPLQRFIAPGIVLSQTFPLLLSSLHSAMHDLIARFFSLGALEMSAMPAGVFTHLFFRKHEPRSLDVVALFALIFVIGTAVIYTSLPLGFFFATFLVGRWLAFYVGFMLASICGYRISPWHPLALAGIPGPVMPRLSKWWTVHVVARGKRHVALQKLHAKYGPWLRVGPNEVSVCLSAAVRPIYSKLPRAPFYQAAPTQADALITLLDRAEHAHRRVAWNKAVSSEALLAYQPLIHNRLQQLVETLRRRCEDGSAVPLDHWLTLFSMDTMGDLAFSGGFETMANGKDPEGWLDILSLGVVFAGTAGQVPWLKDTLKLLPQQGPIATFQKFAETKVKNIRGQSHVVKKDMLSIIMEETTITEEEAAADAALLIVAATDTTAQVLTALFRHLAQNAPVMTRLRQEVLAAFPALDSELDPLALARLPFLDACVQEALRLAPPAPFGPPRFSGPDGVWIVDRYIPPNTTIHAPIWSLHHDPVNFARPDDFFPERWLAESTLKPHNRDAFVPFSYGYGICVGKQLALRNVRLVTATLVRAFDIQFPVGFDVKAYDRSHKEYGLWSHDSLQMVLRATED